MELADVKLEFKHRFDAIEDNMTKILTKMESMSGVGAKSDNA